MGAGDQVVGVTHECDFPEAALALAKLTSSAIESTGSAAEIDRHVRRSLHAGSSLYHLDAELLESLQPDLIVTQELCAVCAVSYDIVARAAKRLRGDPRIVSLEPSSVEDVFSTIAVLGELTQCEAGATALIGQLRAGFETLRDRTRSKPPQKTLLLEWTDPPMSAGHWIPELVECAGGTPVLAHPGTDSQRLEWDAIAAADPAAIVVAPCGFDLVKTQRAVAELDALPQWKSLRAVSDGRVYPMDGNAYVSRPGPRLLDSAEIIAGLLDRR